MWTLNSIDIENRVDICVTEVMVMLRWSVTLNNNSGVGNSLKKGREMRVENYPPLGVIPRKMTHLGIWDTIDIG